jgi:hypothetical protein
LVVVVFLAAASSRAGTPGLVAHWKFDEGSGTSASDSSGNGHTATLVGGASFVSGRQGNAVSFDGNDDRVVVPHAADLDFGNGSFTVLLWFKTSEVSQRYLMAKNYSPSQPFWGIAVCGPGVEQGVNGYVHDGSKTSQAPDKLNYADGQWHYLAFVRDRGALQLRLHMDGARVTTAADASGSVANTAALLIGDIATPGYKYRGLIDDVKLFNRALSPAEIEQESLPDLLISSISYTPGTYAPGSVLMVTGTESNYSTVDVNNFYLQARLSKDTTWGNSDDVVVWDFMETQWLDGGEDSTSTYGVVIPSGTPAGIYYLAVRIDTTNVINESNESNNTWWSATANIVVSPPAPRATVVFTASQGGQTNVWRVGDDGSGTLQLTTDGSSYGGRISPDGSTIA